jgi:putative thioredoxin
MLAETPAPPPSDGLVKDTTTAAFRQDVIQESLKQPVLVDFWAPWCGPCKQLTPVIEKAVKAAGGKVKLVKMDIDQHPQIPGQLGIQSIPAVIAFSKGQPVDGFMGALPESQVKGFIERLVGPVGPSAAEDLLAEADARAEEGDAGGAAELYAAVLAQDPENVAAIAALAKLHLELDDLEGAKRFLAMAPQGKENDAAIAGARAAIELAEQAASLGDAADLQRRVEANPLDHQARFDLALALNARGKREEAIDQLIEIVRRDRNWNDDGARKQLVQFFEAWGPTDDMTVLGRRRLSSVLFA